MQCRSSNLTTNGDTMLNLIEKALYTAAVRLMNSSDELDNAVEIACIELIEEVEDDGNYPTAWDGEFGEF